ncbi:MAG: signal peptidase I [Clostridiales bacterium]|nr:signal peptidase I [Candidatus Apopatocola equi]
MKQSKALNDRPSLSQLEAELVRENYRGKYRRTLRSTVSVLIVTAAVVVLLAFLIFPVFRIYGSSMAPTINEGEIVVSLKDSRFECGDIIVLSYNNKLLVKRVIAGPGEWVDIDKDGNVYVNGMLIDEPYLTEKAFGDCNISLPYQIADGRYFVMGDNRSTSQDSRNSVVGCIAEEQIVGRAICRLWPLSELGVFNRK